MNAEISEALFQAYLERLSLAYERHVIVHCAKNVDFRVEGDTPIFCDIKEIRPSSTMSRRIDAHSHLREDLSDLRKKFGPSRPNIPVLLIAINFSGRLLTGLSVARSMLGDVGVDMLPNGRSGLHHLPRGNASMTCHHLTRISGVFVFDCETDDGHAVFPNPYAAYPISAECFPLVKRLYVAKDMTEDQLKVLANINFWPSITRVTEAV